ncbi:MAG TPA: YciI family protein [Acetobacteraceae bacterium]|jgi:uncharacterized protein YciI|nr:YciI family protein [Acetobacteraceae bacterium]
MVFVVIAQDGRDEGAVPRRMATRPRHMQRIMPCAERGELLAGIALLNEPGGRMVGSVMVLDLPDEEAVRAWLAADPYAEAGVWQDITILPGRVAPLPYRPLGQAAA